MTPFVSGGRSNFITGYLEGDDTNINYGDDYWLAQTFTLFDTYDIFRCAIKSWAEAAGYTYRFYLHATDAQGKPTGLPISDIGSSSTDEAIYSPGKWRRFDFPGSPTLPPGTYAIVFSRPGAPWPMATKARADTSSPTFFTGKAWSSTNSGSTWTELPNTTFIFQVWGWTPPPYPPLPPEIGNWAPLDFFTSESHTGFRLTVQTDRTVHLYMRWTKEEPLKHPSFRIQRGIPLMSGLRYCFVAFNEVEQEELGDTYIHTFHLPNWPVCETRWFYFIGTVILEEIPSSSPVFHLHRTEPTLTLFATYTKDLGDGNLMQVFIRKSTDIGASWTDEVKVSFDPTLQGYLNQNPCIAVDTSGRLWVAWSGAGTYGGADLGQLLASYSDDNGLTWAPFTKLSTQPGAWHKGQYRPDICITSDHHVHVVWRGDDGNVKIWYSEFDGLSWSAPHHISPHPGPARPQDSPVIDSDKDDNLHVAWHGFSNIDPTHAQIFHSSRTNGTWSPPTHISSLPGMLDKSHSRPTIAVSPYDNTVHITWAGRDATYSTHDQIWHRKFRYIWFDITRVSTLAGMDINNQWRPAVTSTLYGSTLCYWDGRAVGDTYQKIYRNIYDGSNWSVPLAEPYTSSTYAPTLRGSYYPPTNVVIYHADIDYRYQLGSDWYANIGGTISGIVGDPTLQINLAAHRLVRLY